MTAIPILVQFVFRLTFGMALAMAATPSSMVTAGFYRVHLWVLMGLNTFAALALFSDGPGAAEHAAGTSPATTGAFGVAVGLTLASYVGAVIWLYERRRAGLAILLFITVGGAAGALLATNWGQFDAAWLAWADVLSSGLLLGSVMTAMLLGHWYLNTPSMKLQPLEKLVHWSTLSTLLRMAVCGTGAVLFLTRGDGKDATSLLWTFVAFRWVAGLLSVGLMIYMTRQTLRVPNTQSATGILYAAVILVFLGELVSQMLTGDARHPM